MKLVIDCCGIGYKIAYGMPALSFDGNNTHIIYGFLKQMLNLSEKFKTNQFIYCWDSRQSYRKELYAGYKKRDNDPDKEKLIADARRQFDLLRQGILPAMGFQNVFMQSGYEADDLMAWICARFPDDYMVVSADEDMLQILQDPPKYYTMIYDFNKEKIITAKNFIDKYGFEPLRWALVKAYAGCSSDKVPGIPGIGEGTAVKYINGVLKSGKLLDKIESPEGKQIFQDCLSLVGLPFYGERQININEIKDDKLFSLDFRDAFLKYGFVSFVDSNNFETWKSVFQLVSGR